MRTSRVETEIRTWTAVFYTCFETLRWASLSHPDRRFWSEWLHLIYDYLHKWFNIIPTEFRQSCIINFLKHQILNFVFCHLVICFMLMIWNATHGLRTQHYLIYIHIPDSVHIGFVSFSVPYGVSTFACLGSRTLQNIILPTTSLEFDKSIVSTMLSHRFIWIYLAFPRKWHPVVFTL